MIKTKSRNEDPTISRIEQPASWASSTGLFCGLRIMQDAHLFSVHASRSRHIRRRRMEFDLPRFHGAARPGLSTRSDWPALNVIIAPLKRREI
jgi:hypothetical protein